MTLDWHIVTSEQFKEGTPDPAHLYFLSDTKEIYRGSDKFSLGAVLYTTAEGLPAALAENTVYFNTDTCEGKVKNADGNMVTVIKPLGAVDAANTDKPVSGADVVNYVTGKIAEGANVSLDGVVVKVEWDAANAILTSTYGDTAATKETIVFDGLGTTMEFDSATGQLNMKDVSGNVLSTVELGKEKFVSSASYDAEHKKIILSFNDDTAPLEIDVADLVDTYDFQDSDSIAFTSANNIVSANIVVSRADGNTLQVVDDGIFVPATDITGKADKIVDALGGKVLLSTADGGYGESTVVIGGATMSDAPDENTLATEAALKAVKDGLIRYVNDNAKTTFDASKAGEITIVADDGTITTSGIKLGGATFAETPSAGLVATEAGVATYVNEKTVGKTDIVATAADSATTIESASETKVISEKTFVESHSWKTTM